MAPKENSANEMEQCSGSPITRRFNPGKKARKRLKMQARARCLAEGKVFIADSSEYLRLQRIKKAKEQEAMQLLNKSPDGLPKDDTIQQILTENTEMQQVAVQPANHSLEGPPLDDPIQKIAKYIEKQQVVMQKVDSYSPESLSKDEVEQILTANSEKQQETVEKVDHSPVEQLKNASIEQKLTDASEQKQKTIPKVSRKYRLSLPILPKAELISWIEENYCDTIVNKPHYRCKQCYILGERFVKENVRH